MNAIIFTSVALKSARRSPEACARSTSLATDRAHPVAGVADLVPVVGGEHHQLAQAEVAGHGGGGVLEVGDEALPRVGRGACLLRDGDELVDPFPEQFGDQ